MEVKRTEKTVVVLTVGDIIHLLKTSLPPVLTFQALPDDAEGCSLSLTGKTCVTLVRNKERE